MTVDKTAMCGRVSPCPVLCRRSPRGLFFERKRRKSYGEGVGDSRVRWWKDGATGGTRHDSKRVGTGQLAEGAVGQHGRYENKTNDLPRPSTPSPDIQSHLRRCRPTASTRTTQNEPCKCQWPQENLPGHTTASNRTGQIGRKRDVVYGLGTAAAAEQSRQAIREAAGVGATASSSSV
ncbi:hypothetical protein OG21DRAFT_815741 [Imleria badia]|nr:hypothetical protein OG21DRAFT_815741 [Imleria badia]